MDPDQAQQYVRPNLGPNWLQKSSAVDTSRQSLTTVGKTIIMISNMKIEATYTNEHTVESRKLEVLGTRYFNLSIENLNLRVVDITYI